MKRKMITGFAFCIIGLMGVFSPVSAAEKSNKVDVEVLSVLDAETIQVKYKGKTEIVKMLLVDVPEIRNKSIGVQPFGQEAKAYAEKNLIGKPVKLEFDVAGNYKDKYNRMYGYLWVGDVMYNEKLVMQGLARVVNENPPNKKHLVRLKDKEVKAKKSWIGIWSKKNYVTAKGFTIQKQDKTTTNNPTKPTPTKKPAVVTKPSQNTNKTCTIKGNINSKGEKIFHVVGGGSYKVTQAERYFCTEKEAINAGYRKAKNS